MKSYPYLRSRRSRNRLPDASALPLTRSACQNASSARQAPISLAGTQGVTASGTCAGTGTREQSPSSRRRTGGARTDVPTGTVRSVDGPDRTGTDCLVEGCMSGATPTALGYSSKHRNVVERCFSPGPPAAWPNRHPGVEVICRGPGGGLRQGRPTRRPRRSAGSRPVPSVAGLGRAVKTCVAARRDCLRNLTPSGMRPEATGRASGRLQDDSAPIGRRAERKKADLASVVRRLGAAPPPCRRSEFGRPDSDRMVTRRQPQLRL